MIETIMTTGYAIFCVYNTSIEEDVPAAIVFVSFIIVGISWIECFYNNTGQFTEIYRDDGFNNLNTRDREISHLITRVCAILLLFNLFK